LTGLTWDCSPSTSASHISGIADINHNGWLICWDGGLINFLPRLTSNHKLPHLHLLNSWNDRLKTLYPACIKISFLLLLNWDGPRALHMLNKHFIS
jgi:hypothetical protein